MTAEEEAERDILALANERGKFALGVGVSLKDPQQEALERLQEREWIRLIDVTPVAHSRGQPVRIFILTKAAHDWLRTIAS